MKGKPVETIICHPEDLPEPVRNTLYEMPDRMCRDSGRIYIKLENAVICCPDDQAGNELAHELTVHTVKTASKPRNAADIYSMILRDPQFIPDHAMLKNNRIRLSVRHIAVVFRCLSSLKEDLFSLFSEIVPLESGDAVVPLDYQSVIMIKEMENRTTDELTEYVEAAVCTMESEGISEVRAGAGTEADDLKDLRRSFREGIEALRLGIKYHRRDHIYHYSDLTIERIVDCVPEKEMEQIRNVFLGSDNLTVNNDEMLETVRCFMKNDLNLTAASKQLFIHRNTLNYRLDKIKKETGLDLRSFRDAVIFRLVSMIPEEE